jgi:DNA-binding GntR family transcriptional regulator
MYSGFRVQQNAGIRMASTTSLADQVYESILVALREGRYRHGDRLREEDIARTFGVSRTPVRAALARLLQRGLLQVSQNGLQVAHLSRPQVVELYAMRELLEGAAARFAAQHASEGDIYTLRRICARFDAPGQDAARLAEHNLRFHAAIYEAAHNRYLMATLQELYDTLMLLPSTTFAADSRHEAAVQEHRAILDAIRARDADEAERLAREHIGRARDTRLAMMFEA